MQTSAPGKLILCGEHAVVYQRPAIAIPLRDVRATITIAPAAPGSGLTVKAPELRAVWRLQAQEPLSALASMTLDYLKLAEPDVELTIASALPIASGMGSGAAVGTALVRALAYVAGRTLDAASIAELVYTSERAFHGTPSGIDNTVVAYEQPIWFQRQAAGPPLIAPLEVGGPWTLVVADTGVASSTHAVVGDLRARWQADPAPYERSFDAVAALVVQVRAALGGSDGAALGALLNRNHELLVELGVSAAQLDTLVAAARSAGAWGAKMSGAGWGGVMLALVAPAIAATVAEALRTAGAARTWITHLERTP